jgi:hypothetical protein
MPKKMKKHSVKPPKQGPSLTPKVTKTQRRYDLKGPHS